MDEAFGIFSLWLLSVLLDKKTFAIRYFLQKLVKALAGEMMSVVLSFEVYFNVYCLKHGIFMIFLFVHFLRFHFRFRRYFFLNQMLILVVILERSEFFWKYWHVILNQAVRKLLFRTESPKSALKCSQVISVSGAHIWNQGIY